MASARWERVFFISFFFCLFFAGQFRSSFFVDLNHLNGHGRQDHGDCQGPNREGHRRGYLHAHQPLRQQAWDNGDGEGYEGGQRGHWRGPASSNCGDHGAQECGRASSGEESGSPGHNTKRWEDADAEHRQRNSERGSWPLGTGGAEQPGRQTTHGDAPTELWGLV